jgi:hypothetical protein
LKVERLVIFCAECPKDLGQTCAWVREALVPLGVRDAELKPVPGPASLAQAGWSAFGVFLPKANKQGWTFVRERLEGLADRLSKQLGDDVLCVYVDPTHRRSRACLQSPSGFPRSSEGESFHVLRETANWVEADPVQLLRFFNAANGESPESEPEAEPDEVDRFVQAKLEEARKLMAEYLSRKEAPPP